MTVIVMTVHVSYHGENNHGYEVQGILTQVFSL